MRTAFRIVDVLQDMDGVTMNELATQLDLAKSTVHNYLGTLHQQGYLVKSGEQYRIGLRFLSLGGHAAANQPGYQLLRTKVNQVANETHERAQCIVEEDGKGFYIYEMTGSDAVRTDVQVGKQVHLHTISAGKAILAHLPDARVEKILDYWGLPERTEHTITSRDELLDLDRIFVMNNRGQKIPLSSFASTRRDTGPVDISRENQRRTIHITGGLAPGATLDQVSPRLRRAISENIPAEQDLIIDFGGDYADLLRYGRTFGIIMLISVFLVFGVMASEFESFVDPFIIIFTVPFLIVGVLLLYFLTGQTLSLFTAVGLVVLVGIVVNNGIVFVDYTNLLRKRGLSIRDAVIGAGGNRLRPILMTTLTTVLGLVPVAFFRGEGSTLVQPIGQTVVGGLSVGTAITLFVIPVIYAIVNRVGERRAERHERKREERIERELAQEGEE